MSLKIKDWKLFKEVEKNDISFMKNMMNAYEQQKQDYENNETYVKVANQIYKLEKAAEKATAEEQQRARIAEEKEKLRKERELASLLKEQEKETKKESYTLKRRTSELDLDELIAKFNFYMTCTGGLTWYYQLPFEDEYGNREWKAIKKETLLANFAAVDVYVRGAAGEADYSSLKEFQKKLSDRGNIFSSVIQSYTKDTCNGKLNIMNRTFCPPSLDDSIDYHWMFDALIESLSGSSEDKEDPQNPFQHFQKVLIGKYQHPENIFLPALIINDKGSTGKGVFGSRFLQRLFNGNVADNCTIEHLTGKFNGMIAGKAVVYINETAKEKVDAGRVKAFIGSPTFMVENKFETPYSCDNTALVISATNESAGAITLEGTNSDRRFSIFSPKGDIYKIVARYRMEKDGLSTCSEEEADIWVKEVGQWLLFDKEQMGKWITAMTLKYGDVKHVPRLQGNDYKHMLERQRSGWLQTVDDIFNDPDFVYIREQLLRDLVREYNKSEKYLPGRKKMTEDIERLIKDRGLNIELKDRVNIYDTVTGTTEQRTVWRIVGTMSINKNESKYGIEDDKGRFVWTYRG